MIKVTRLNGKPMIVNAELIRFIEQTPDTLITLISGDKLLVKESMEEVVRRAIEYSRSIRTNFSNL
ncbi:MAG: flagellar FlbD family protein [Phycisphaerae bacterium]|jgi:flagellar protein FlbD|nr:flagellar FlbD family protein [Phycisphaerae bacterium]